MFLVESKSPFDDDWQARDKQIRAAALPCRHTDSGTDFCERDHAFLAETFEQALALKERLEAIPDVRATIQEQTTGPR